MVREEERERERMGPYSGSPLAKFVRVGCVVTGVTYGFVVSGIWSFVKPAAKGDKKRQH